MSHNPTEHVQEELHHHAAHGSDHEHDHGHGGKWITAAATTAAILAAFAAASGALATRHLVQSTLIRIKANDDWNYYQAKSIKSSLLDAKIYSAQLSKAEPRKSDLDKKEEYAKQMPEIQASAKEYEQLSREHLEAHETFEGSATLFHIAIAIVAVAVVARRREFWYISMIGGLIGLVIFGKALLHVPPAMKEKEEPPAKSAPAHPTEKQKEESAAKSEPAHPTEKQKEESAAKSEPAHTSEHVTVSEA